MESVQPNPSSSSSVQNSYFSSETLIPNSQNQSISFQNQTFYNQNQENSPSYQQNHPPVSETLAASFNQNPTETETLVSNQASEALTSEKSPSQQEKTENGVKNTTTTANANANANATHSGADRGDYYSGGEEETSSKRKRRSRWDPPESDNQNGDGGGGTRRRKTRWADDEPKPVIQLPDFMKEFTGNMDLDPEVQVLNIRLLEISRMLSSGLPLDDRPEGARSPSPEPIYDNLGIRINTREYRARERLTNERLDIISQLIKRNPAFKPPADYRPPKLQKKLYIPMKEYPGYNFIGLIIGPRGNTQKRMEKETGAKIVIRGKGSIKEGRLQQKRDLKPDPSENEDLHVLVEAETQEALEAAAGMLEKLLQPVDEVLNEHKRQQLRELAALNGTIRDEEYCRSCGEPGHRQYACPTRTSTFKSDVLCKICGDGGHPTIDCPVKGTTGKKMDDEYQNFLAELGGSAPESLTKQNSAVPLLGSSSSASVPPPWASGNNHAGIGATSQTGLMANGAKTGKEYDDTNLYIGYLPPNLEDDGLVRLFSSFGDIVMAKVIKDRGTGLSKGYGFVKYSDAAQANQAIASMNGYHLDGRVIAVRVAGKPPQPAVPAGPPAQKMPTYPVPNQTAGGYPPHQFTPTGPPSNAAPPSGYMGAPVPWGPPLPPSYAPYAPPPPGSSIYPPVQGHSVPSYTVQYHSSLQTVPPGAPPSSIPSSEGQQNFPPGLQSQNTYAPSIPTSMYGMPPNTYPPSSLGYTSYYSVPPPPVSHSTVDQPQSIGTSPWASSQPAPPPNSTAEQTSSATDSEYEKFMGEMK